MFDLYSLFVFLAVQVRNSRIRLERQLVRKRRRVVPVSGCTCPYFSALMFLLMMLTSKPQQKEQQRQKLAALDTLKKNDKVVTAGGIVGTVVTPTAIRSW